MSGKRRRSAVSPAQALLRELESAIECLRQLAVTVQNYEESSERNYFTLLHKYVKHLRVIESMSGRLDVDVPIPLVQWVDEGRNPFVFTQQVARQTLRRSELVDAKIAKTMSVHEELKKAQEQLVQGRKRRKTDQDAGGEGGEGGEGAGEGEEGARADEK